MKREFPDDAAFALEKFRLAMSCVPLCDDMLRFHLSVAAKIVRQIEFNETYVALPDSRTGFEGEILEFTAFCEKGKYILNMQGKPITPKELSQISAASLLKDKKPKSRFYKFLNWIAISLKLKKD